MAAHPPLEKKIAATMPLAVVVRHCIIVVVALDGDLELLKLQAMWLLSILPGLLNLADHARVHLFLLLADKQKNTEAPRGLVFFFTRYAADVKIWHRTISVGDTELDGSPPCFQYTLFGAICQPSKFFSSRL